METMPELVMGDGSAQEVSRHPFVKVVERTVDGGMASRWSHQRTKELDDGHKGAPAWSIGKPWCLKERQGNGRRAKLTANKHARYFSRDRFKPKGNTFR